MSPPPQEIREGERKNRRGRDSSASLLLLFSLTAPPHVADEGRDEDHGSEGEGEGSLSSPGDGGDEDSNKEGPILRIHGFSTVLVMVSL